MQENQPFGGELSDYMDFVLRRRWVILACWALVLTGTMLAAFFQTPVYQASALLVIEKERSAGAGSTGSLIESANEDYYQTQYRLMESASLLGKVYDTLELGRTAEFAEPGGLAKLKKAVSILPVIRSRLVHVRAQSEQPALAARIANTLAQTYVAENLSNQLFISKEILQTLQQTEDTPEARRLYETLPQVVNSSLIQSLKADYAKLEAKEAELAQRYTAKHPAMLALLSNMEVVERQIKAETDKIVQSLKIELSGQLRGNNVRVVDPAQVPQSPIKPKFSTSLLWGLVGGLIFGLAMGFVIELLDQSIRTQEEVERRLSLPYVGTLPANSQEAEDVPYGSLLAEEPSLTGEAFRNLRTMVDFAGLEGAASRLFVTSAVEKEGKSYVSSNLAVALAQMGQKALLIDGDLRRPKLHRNFKLSGERGLSDFLAGGTSTEEIARLVQKSEVDNLDVLVCGMRPPNPSELLNTPRLSALLAWAASRYERVLVDCPPMFPINDTLLWGRHIRSSILVVRYGQTRIPLIRNASQKLQASGVKILGVAVNAAAPRGLAYAAYGYHYQQYYQNYREPETARSS